MFEQKPRSAAVFYATVGLCLPPMLVGVACAVGGVCGGILWLILPWADDRLLVISLCLVGGGYVLAASPLVPAQAVENVSRSVGWWKLGNTCVAVFAACFVYLGAFAGVTGLAALVWLVLGG